MQTIKDIEPDAIAEIRDVGISKTDDLVTLKSNDLRALTIAVCMMISSGNYDFVEGDLEYATVRDTRKR